MSFLPVLLFAALFVTLTEQTALGQMPIRATTEGGRPVLLMSDGSWKYEVQITKPADKPRDKAVCLKTAAQTERITLRYGDAALWIDPSKWKQTKNENGRISFTRDAGKAFGMVLSEGFGGIPTDTMERVALANAQQVDPNARVVVREHRVVNGREVLYLELEATNQGIPFRFAGYYHGGVKSDLQVLAFTLRSEFDNLKPELEQFINGIEIPEESTSPVASTVFVPASPAVLSFGSFQLKYNPEKWTVKEEAGEPGTWVLTHKRGDAYGKFIAERTAMPLDSLIAVAIQRMQEQDKDARIVSQEDRTISGVQAKQLRIDASPSGIPMAFLGYYYGGNAGAVQVIGYTGRQLFKDYQEDFRELLQGLTIYTPSH